MFTAPKAVSAAVFVSATVSFAQSGAMFRGDPAHTGVYESAAPKSINHILWEFKTGGRIFSLPVVADGIVYAGSNDHFLHAVIASAGREIWKFKTEADVTSTPAVANGSAYILSLDGISSPAIADGMVYVTTSDSMKFRAMELKTGKPLFELAFKAYSFSSPAIAGGHAYFGTFDGLVHDVDLSSHTFCEAFGVHAAVEHKDLLTADGHLNLPVIYGPLGPDGKPNNTLDAAIVGVDRLLELGSILSSPAVSNGIVYAASMDGSIYALD